MYVSRTWRTLGIALGAVVCAGLFGAGIPIGWLWIASQLQPRGEQGIGGLALLVLVAGTIASFALAGLLLSRVAGGRRGDERPRRMSWNRSLSDGAARKQDLSALEQIMVLTTLLVAAACEIWFALFAHQTPWGG
jgi:hypothetical protein